MKINVRGLMGVEPKIEMRAPQTLEINVDINKGQMQDLFYKIWTDVGDEILQEWLNSEEKQMIDLPKCTHEFTTECIDNGELIKVLCTKCGEQLNDERIVELPLPEDVEVEAKMVLRSMNIKKGYGKDFTDDDILDGLKLMCANYRKYLLKTV